eukprot:1419283-Pleurochrysis_carterae.AAC.1
MSRGLVLGPRDAFMSRLTSEKSDLPLLTDSPTLLIRYNPTRREQNEASRTAGEDLIQIFEGKTRSEQRLI